MESNSVKKKKLKFFNKVYGKMQDSLMISLKKTNEKRKIKNYEELDLFVQEIDSQLNLYNEKDSKLFKSVKVLEEVLKDKPELNSKNKDIMWKYVSILYSIVKKENKSLQEQGNNLEQLVKGIMNNQNNNGLKTVIEGIANDLEAAKKNNVLNEQQIISDLLSGNMNSCGIDFGNIINNTVKKLEQKINSGEIKKEELLNVSDKLKEVITPKN